MEGQNQVLELEKSTLLNEYFEQSTNAITIKSLMSFFTELGQKSVKFRWTYKDPKYLKKILKKKWTGGIPDFRLYYKTTMSNS